MCAAMSDRLNKLTQMYETDPNDPFLTYGIALEHGKSGQFEEAVDWLDKTLSLDEHYCYAYFQKAKMLSEQGDDDAAKAVLDKGMTAAQHAGDSHAREEMAELLTSME
jgi:tetratricopeptide (TPR) repeat protein